MDITVRLRRASALVYLATEESVANDLSDMLKSAADEIEQLRVKLEARLERDPADFV